ncbi:MAG: threonine synthase, partial [Eubacteriales bacterium]|nr:threonine synthase [Eubacteriales bacterium]
AENGLMFSSANSINWGRLVPQIVYYCSAYADMLEKGRVAPGEAMNVVVPTGNFGNILAAYYAKLMGVPVGKLICASNANNVLTDFLTTGTYDRNRTFYTTMSPSMDILISSNLERLLFHLSGEDDAAIRDWMGKLATTGVYTVSDEVFAQIKEHFAAGCADDETVSGVIRKTWEEDGYLSDTHTGVAITVYRDYCSANGDETPTVIAATASPYKFSKSVLTAVLGETPDLDEFDMAGALSEKTGVKIPAPLSNLKDKTVRFTTTCAADDMEQQVYDMLGI